MLSAVLAYVFWHGPGADVGPADYARMLLAFHERLAADPPPGFARSWSWSTARPAATGSRADGFEDWYLVADWEALGQLNAAAVTGSRAAAHEAVADAAGPGAGGVYALLAGVPDPGHAWKARLGKPAGLSYEAFLAPLLVAAVGERGVVWQRQMVLGPEREFLVYAPQELLLPSPAEGFAVEALERPAPEPSRATSGRPPSSSRSP